MYHRIHAHLDTLHRYHTYELHIPTPTLYTCHTCRHTFTYIHVPQILHSHPPMDPHTQAWVYKYTQVYTCPQTCRTYSHSHHRLPFHRHSRTRHTVHIVICTTTYFSYIYMHDTHMTISPHQHRHILRCAHSLSWLKVGFASAEATLQEAVKGARWPTSFLKGQRDVRGLLFVK